MELSKEIKSLLLFYGLDYKDYNFINENYKKITNLNKRKNKLPDNYHKYYDKRIQKIETNINNYLKNNYISMKSYNKLIELI